MRLLYSALFYVLLPLILARLLWRSRKLPAYRARWRERFACYETPPEASVVWFHAVSVGEAEAAFPLIVALRRRHPGRTILVTCTTPTGSSRVQAVLGDTVRHVYLPYDLPDAVARFLDHYRPELAVILETEIWPNLYRQCRRRGIPLAIVNGRLSPRSARRYRHIGGLTARAVGCVSLVLAQTAEDAERYLSIGLPADRVAVAGNVKFDIDFTAAMEDEARRLRGEIFGQRPTWIAGSTHPGEEEQILAAFRKVKSAVADAVLILAPRHPERAAELAAWCEKGGWSVRRRSERLPCAPEIDVFLVDTLGELRLLYGVADVAFVGGSLVPRGGHNVLEPASAGVATIFGPHMFNFSDIARRLVAQGIGMEVPDFEALAEMTVHLLTTPDVRASLGKKGREFVTANRGAVERTIVALESLLIS